MKNKNSLPLLEGKPIITYPTKWEYRVIGKSEMKIKKAVFEIISEVYSLETKNKSPKGKFVSLNLIILVNSGEERDEIFKNLSNHKDIMTII